MVPESVKSPLVGCECVLGAREAWFLSTSTGDVVVFATRDSGRLTFGVGCHPGCCTLLTTPEVLRV